MAAYELVIRPSVRKDVESVPTKDLKRILARIEKLREDPRPPGSMRLSGNEYYRIRQGNYRIIYEVADAPLIVVVVKIGHRRDVDRQE